MLDNKSKKSTGNHGPCSCYSWSVWSPSSVLWLSLLSTILERTPGSHARTDSGGWTFPRVNGCQNLKHIWSHLGCPSKGQSAPRTVGFGNALAPCNDWKKRNGWGRGLLPMHPPMPSYTTCWIFWLYSDKTYPWVPALLEWCLSLKTFKTSTNDGSKGQQQSNLLGYNARMANDLTRWGWRTDTTGKRFVVRAVVHSVMASRDWIAFDLLPKFLMKQN